MSGSNPALLINVYCKFHLHKDKQGSWRATTTIINNMLHMRRPLPVYENAKCGETALSPQCCRVQQISVPGCKKNQSGLLSSLSRLDEPLCWFWVQVSSTSPDKRGTQQQSPSSWLLILSFFFLWQPRCHGLVRSREHPSGRSHRSNRASLLALSFVRSRVRRF